MWIFRITLIGCSICISICIDDDVSDNQPKVRTKYGSFNGYRVGDHCNAFVGIRFAEPPIDKLRFERPVPLKPSTVIRDATKWPPRCIQMSQIFQPPDIADSEDCLYLNVFAPKKKSEIAAYPVMVWIHGGGFQFGSSFEYGDKGICKNLVSNGVIVVSIQYRVGFFGFLSTGDSKAPGNMGLWDQIEALKWVKENIYDFGGDSNKITIFGESAGGTSVSLLTYAPAAQDYFHQSIAQSGSANSMWSVVTNSTVGMTEKLAKSVGCHDSPSSEKTLECLRKLSFEQLMNASSNLQYDLLLVDIPPAQRRNITHIITTTFFNEESEFSLETFRNFTSTLLSTFSLKHQPILQRLIEYVYLDTQENQKTNKTFLQEQAIRVYDDALFNLNAFNDAKAKFNENAPIWMYHFDYYSAQMFAPNDNFKSCSHTFELAYLFYMEHCNGCMFDINFKSNDIKIAKLLGLLWTNFAKFGNPTPPGKAPTELNWPQFALNSTKHLLIGLDSHIDQYFYQARMQFWLHLLPSMVDSLD